MTMNHTHPGGLLSSAALMLFVVACNDYGYSEIVFPDPEPRDSTPTETAAPVDSEPPEDSEAPPVCSEGPWSPGSAAVDETCVFEAETGSFAPVVEWSIFDYDDFSDRTHTAMTPAVGQLTDDNGDGVIDASDVPDVVVVQKEVEAAGEDSTGVLRLLSGDGSGVHWSVAETTLDGVAWTPNWSSGVALGHMDDDDVPEIAVTVTDGSSRYLGLYSNAGELRWVNTEAVLRNGGNAPALADLDGDGNVEIIVGRAIYNAADGTLRGEGAHGYGYSTSYGWAGYHSFAADLDGDGIQEVVAGNALYDADGNTVCFTGYGDGYPAAADLDGDGLGEFVISGNGEILIFDHACWFVDRWELLDSGYGGPVTLADYDGDGEPEIGIAARDYYFVYESDGTLLWYNPVQDYSSNSTGSSVYDFDGDGYAEVVYADEEDLWVYQGTDGHVRLRDTTHTSGTVNEYPVIVDVDGDGEVEIVVPDKYGVYVVGDEAHGWVEGRQVWNQSSYNIVNVNDDLTIPTFPDPSWPEHNNFRSGDITPAFGAAAPDPLPQLVDICLDECDRGTVQVVIQLGNGGLGEIPVGLPVSVYAGAGDDRLLLQTFTIPDAVVSGATSPGVAIVLDSSSLPDGVLTIVVDDDGTGAGTLTECSEDNNELIIEEGLCP
jgi:hypothetical protein